MLQAVRVVRVSWVVDRRWRVAFPSSPLAVAPVFIVQVNLVAYSTVQTVL